MFLAIRISQVKEIRIGQDLIYPTPLCLNYCCLYQPYRALIHIINVFTLQQTHLARPLVHFCDSWAVLELETNAFSASDCQQSSFHSCHMGFPKKKGVRTASLGGNCFSHPRLENNQFAPWALCSISVLVVLLPDLSHTQKKRDRARERNFCSGFVPCSLYFGGGPWVITLRPLLWKLNEETCWIPSTLFVQNLHPHHIIQVNWRIPGGSAQFPLD